MEEQNKKKKIRIIIASIFAIIVILGVSYAYYIFAETGKNNQVVLGNIYMNLTEGDEKTTSNIPSATNPNSESDAIVFTVSGTNEASQPVYYDINVAHGDKSTTPGAIRVDDEFVSFILQEKTSDEPETWTTIVDSESYPVFSNGYRIHADTIAASATVSRTYRLYFWINDKIRLYGGDYNIDDINKLYASVKVKVTGDFSPRTLGTIFYNELFDKEHNKGVSDTTVVFSSRSGNDGKTGLYYMNSTASDKYPIYYFRGDYKNNNVVFGGFCWKIVRTTDTGGIKMIYNGVYSEANKCSNSDENGASTNTTTGIGTSVFNANYKSLAHMGYSYPNKITTKNGTKINPYEWVANDTGLLSRTTVLYGADVEYDDATGKYKLKGGTVTGAPDATHHYSLNSSDVNATDTKVRYYYYANLSPSAAMNYYIELLGGDKIEDAVRSMTEEKVDAYSTVQTKINGWYDTNLKTKYGDYIEDTVWCMDRSASDLGAWNPAGGLTGYYNTKPFIRASNGGGWTTGKEPRLSCENDNDKLKYANGHGNIGSKAALLTYDEVGLAGMTWYTSTTYRNNYLYTGYWYWLLSPAYFNDDSARAGTVALTGSMDYTRVHNTDGSVRPVISLKHGTQVFNKTAAGTEADPYIVGTNI